VRFAVLGASGATGAEIARTALADGHEVLAFVRDPARLAVRHTRLRVIAYDLMDPSWAGHLAGADAVISALGSTSRHPDGLYSRGAVVILHAMQEARVRRLVTMTAGAYVRSPAHPWLFRTVGQPLLLAILRPTYDDMLRMESILARTGGWLDWTVVRPGRLVGGPATGRARTAPGGFPAGGLSVTRADVARVMVDCARTGAFLRQYVGVSA
jgi:putative NADH-flavin reductase